MVTIRVSVAYEIGEEGSAEILQQSPEFLTKACNDYAKELAVDMGVESPANCKQFLVIVEKDGHWIATNEED